MPPPWRHFFRVAIYSTGVTFCCNKSGTFCCNTVVEWQLITTTSSPHCKTEVAFYLAPLPIFPLMFCLFACVYAKRTRLMLLIFLKLRRLSTRLLKLETMTSSAEFELKFRAIEREHGEVHLDEYFTEPIAKMLERTADSLNVSNATSVSHLGWVRRGNRFSNPLVFARLTPRSEVRIQTPGLKRLFSTWSIQNLCKLNWLPSVLYPAT